MLNEDLEDVGKPPIPSLKQSLEHQQPSLYQDARLPKQNNSKSRTTNQNSVRSSQKYQSSPLRSQRRNQTTSVKSQAAKQANQVQASNFQAEIFLSQITREIQQVQQMDNGDNPEDDILVTKLME